MNNKPTRVSKMGEARPSSAPSPGLSMNSLMVSFERRDWPTTAPTPGESLATRNHLKHSRAFSFLQNFPWRFRVLSGAGRTGAVSEQFQSSFHAISRQFPRNFRAYHPIEMTIVSPSVMAAADLLCNCDCIEGDERGALELIYYFIIRVQLIISVAY